jgi:hypothetical protein
LTYETVEHPVFTPVNTPGLQRLSLRISPVTAALFPELVTEGKRLLDANAATQAIWKRDRHAASDEAFLQLARDREALRAAREADEKARDQAKSTAAALLKAQETLERTHRTLQRIHKPFDDEFHRVKRIQFNHLENLRLEKRL